MSKLTLFKFRSLVDCDSFERARDIIETKKLWCAKLWEMNDPMEGVYTHFVGQLSTSDVESIFSAKNDYVICSLSGETALQRPQLWGYYAGGFKGVAIELEIDARKVDPINYVADTTNWPTDFNTSKKSTLEKLLITKLDSWHDENEFRYLRKGKPGAYKIGTIVRVHFGMPFHNVNNRANVSSVSKPLRQYYGRALQLVSLAKAHAIECRRFVLKMERL